MKGFLKFIAILIIIFVGLFIGRNVIAKTIIETGVHLVTGIELKIAELNIDALNPSLGIKDLRLHNPSGFSDPLMVDLPEFFVAYNIEPLFKGKVHLPEIRVHLKEFVVIKNKDGKVNINALIPAQAQKKPEKPSTDKQKDAGKAPKIQIDKLLLRVEKVVYKDYTVKGNTPSVKEFKINLNESFNNIENPAAVVSLIVAKALMNTTIASLTNIDLGALQASVSETLATSQKVAVDAILKGQAVISDQAKAAKQLAAKAPENLHEAAQVMSGTAKEAVKDLANVADGLKDKLKLPFGKSE